MPARKTPNPVSPLLSSDAFLRAVIAAEPECVKLVSRDGTILDMNPAGVAMIEAATVHDIVGRDMSSLVAPEYRDACRAVVAAVFQGESRKIPFEIIGMKGTHRWLEMHAVPLRDDRDRIIALLGITRDITEQKQQEAAVRLGETRVRGILEAALDAIITIDHLGHILDFNPAAERLFGHSRAAVLGKEMAELIIPANLRAAHRAGLARYLATGEGPVLNRRLELVALRADGSEFPVELAITRVDLPGPPTFTGYLRDLTERRHAEAERRRSESRYRELFESAPVGIYQTTRDGQFLTVNPALARILGYDSAAELQRKNIREVYLDPAERETLIAQYGPHGAAADIEVFWKRRDGTPIRIQLNARAVADNPMYFEGFVHDVTERAQLEDQLRQSQKMEAVGRLAGGIAHDFNNILTAITGYSELLLRELTPEDTRREDVQEIRAAADRAATLTRQLLAFSRKQVLQPQALDLNTIIANLERLLARLIGEHIQLSAILDPGVGRINADPGQIEQVVVNLAVNARDAMPQGGQLTIETRAAQLPAGPHVILSVTDTGVGMDAETQAHIFEPFFTTKAPGKGTGLGLATVYGIVKQSGGDIQVTSAPGRGTAFKIQLPCVSPGVQAAVASAEPPPERGTETVLLVEDDPAVRTLSVQVLKRLGYDVLEAAGGAHALELCDRHPATIHLLLTDVVMPEVGGREVAEEVTRRRPGIKVLYMSGYTDDAIVHHGVLERGLHYLQKPFTPAGLAQKIREVLSFPQ
jgi:PAS domain S-box-containing protein